MRTLISCILCLWLGALAKAEGIFSRDNGKLPLPPRLHTFSPAQLKSGIVTQVLVQGENLLPQNRWKMEGIRVLAERFVDDHNVILLVLPIGNPGLRKARIEGSNELTFEVQSSEILFSDDFEDGELSNWNPSKGLWSVVSGQAQVTAEKVGRLFPVMEDIDNVTIDFDLTLQSGKRAGILFHYRDSRNYRLMLIDAEKNQLRLLDRFNAFYETKKKFPFSVSGTHHFQVIVSNNRVRVTVDGNPFADEDLFYSYRGGIALYAKAATASFDNVLISHDTTDNVIPIADFTFSVAGKSVSLNASSTVDPDGTITSYQWDLGNGATAVGPWITYEYTTSGVYPVTLIVTDNAGARTKVVKNITINGPDDREQIQQVVRRFFELLDDVENLTAEQICVDFSTDPSCPARNKQIADIEAAQPDIQWFEVEFLSDVDVTFQSSTVAYPVTIRNLLRVKYYGDPTIHETDGWHIYRVQKESDGKWHQCWYTFELISES